MDYRIATPEVIVQAIVVIGLLAFAMVLCVWTIRRDSQRRKTHPTQGSGWGTESKWKRMMR